MPRKRGRWLTPSNRGAITFHCVPVIVPYGAEFDRATRGALLMLANPCNWEKVGTVTPDEAAQAYLECLTETFSDWKDCP
jgi:hypothetical protein